MTPGIVPAGARPYHLPAKKALHNTRARPQTYQPACAAALKVEGHRDSEQMWGLCSPGRRILVPPSTCCKRRVDRPASVCFCGKRALANAHRGSFLRRAGLSFLLEQGPPLCEECVSDAHVGRVGAAHAGVNQHAGPSQRVIHSFSASLQQVTKMPTKPRKAASADHCSKN